MKRISSAARLNASRFGGLRTWNRILFCLGVLLMVWPDAGAEAARMGGGTIAPNVLPKSNKSEGTGAVRPLAKGNLKPVAKASGQGTKARQPVARTGGGIPPSASRSPAPSSLPRQEKTALAPKPTNPKVAIQTGVFNTSNRTVISPAGLVPRDPNRGQTPSARATQGKTPFNASKGPPQKTSGPSIQPNAGGPLAWKPINPGQTGSALKPGAGKPTQNPAVGSGARSQSGYRSPVPGKGPGRSTPVKGAPPPAKLALAVRPSAVPVQADSAPARSPVQQAQQPGNPGIAPTAINAPAAQISGFAHAPTARLGIIPPSARLDSVVTSRSPIPPQVSSQKHSDLAPNITVMVPGGTAADPDRGGGGPSGQPRQGMDVIDRSIPEFDDSRSENETRTAETGARRTSGETQRAPSAPTQAVSQASDDPNTGKRVRRAPKARPSTQIVLAKGKGKPLVFGRATRASFTLARLQTETAMRGMARPPGVFRAADSSRRPGEVSGRGIAQTADLGRGSPAYGAAPDVFAGAGEVATRAAVACKTKPSARHAASRRGDLARATACS